MAAGLVLAACSAAPKGEPELYYAAPLTSVHAVLAALDAPANPVPEAAALPAMSPHVDSDAPDQIVWHYDATAGELMTVAAHLKTEANGGGTRVAVEVGFAQTSGGPGHPPKAVVDALNNSPTLREMIRLAFVTRIDTALTGQPQSDTANTGAYAEAHRTALAAEMRRLADALAQSAPRATTTAAAKPVTATGNTDPTAPTLNVAPTLQVPANQPQGSAPPPTNAPAPPPAPPSTVVANPVTPTEVHLNPAAPIVR